MSEKLTISPKVAKTENLKQRAYLNSLTNIIDFGGAQLTGFIISPFIVSGLGSAMYGIWQMLGQMTGYAQMADTRATQALKWSIAKKKDIADADELQSDVSSALVVTAFMLPLVLIIGGIISWYAPIITQASAENYNLVRIACSILISSLVISKAFEIFEAILRGMNLEFKLMGFRVGVVVTGAVLKVLVITNGYGLTGLSIVHLITAFITGLIYFSVVKRHIKWFGFGTTSRKQVLNFSKLSGWYLADTVANVMLTNSDKIILGFLTAPVLVTYYTLTFFLPAAAQGLILRVTGGAVPGIGKLLGLKDHIRVKKAWDHMASFTFLITTASGVTIILFNASFLKVWVGEGYYAGNLANVLIVIFIMQDTFIRNDAYIISATLDVKKKVYISLLSGVIFIGLGFILISFFGIVGLCLSLIITKLILFIGQRKVLLQLLNIGFSDTLRQNLRPLLVSMAMLGVAAYTSVFISTVGLLSMMVLVPLIFILSLVLFGMLGLEKSSRTDLLQAFSAIKLFRSA